MMSRVLIDFGKLKNLYTGLGQISLQYAREMATHALNYDLEYLLPVNFIGKFGTQVHYKRNSALIRYCSWCNSNYDLWHAIHQDSAFMPAKNVPYLLTIHDLNFLEEKSSAKAAMRLKRLQKKVDRARALTFISKFTERIARENLKINVFSKVIYNGVEIERFEHSKPPAFMESVLKRKEKIYFTVGVIKEKKNFHTLVHFIEKVKDGILVMAGDVSGGYARQIREEIERCNLQDRILMPGIISSSERAWLYENCEAFFFPSRVEGFGLPVIEAMSYGKPVFLSTFSSLPEVGGQDAFYWENFNPDYMASVFQENMKTAMTIERVNSRKARARSFNWLKACQDYAELYDMILQDKPLI